MAKNGLCFALFSHFWTVLVGAARLGAQNDQNGTEKGKSKGYFWALCVQKRPFSALRVKRPLLGPFRARFEACGFGTPFLTPKLTFLAFDPVLFWRSVTRDGKLHLEDVKPRDFSRLNTYHARFFRN